MASPLHSLEATICLHCGDKGYPKRLIYCMTCQNSAIHEYCLNNYDPAADDIKWWCWDCRGEDNIKAEPLRKSERIIDKRQKSLKIRNHLKQKLKPTRRLVQISNNIHEAGQLATDGHLPIMDLEPNLVNHRQRDLDILEKEKSIPEIASNSEHNESITNEPTCITNSNLPDKEEHNMKSFDEALELPEFGKSEKIFLLKYNDNAQNDGKDVAFPVSVFVANHSSISDTSNVKSFDEAQKIPELGNGEKIFLLKYSDNAQNDGKDIALPLSVFVANHSSTPDTLCMQPYLESDDSDLSADPLIDPVWRGWLHIKDESEIRVENFAHLSNKACLKASDAAAALPRMLDAILLDKNETWPNSFRAAPPTASSIGLYFFPACERNERVYDGLLDEVIERELALKVMLDNVELLIFPSSELPLQQWRFKSKYFLWGVFKDMQNCSSTMLSTSKRLKLPEPTVTGNEEDLVHSQYADPPSTQIQPYQSPVSTISSQASNLPPSMQTTPESLPLELSMLGENIGAI